MKTLGRHKKHRKTLYSIFSTPNVNIVIYEKLAG